MSRPGWAIRAAVAALAIAAATSFAFAQEAFVATSPDFVTGAPASICSLEDGAATVINEESATYGTLAADPAIAGYWTIRESGSRATVVGFWGTGLAFSESTIEDLWPVQSRGVEVVRRGLRVRLVGFGLSRRGAESEVYVVTLPPIAGPPRLAARSWPWRIVGLATEWPFTWIAGELGQLARYDWRTRALETLPSPVGLTLGAAFDGTSLWLGGNERSYDVLEVRGIKGESFLDATVVDWSSHFAPLTRWYVDGIAGSRNGWAVVRSSDTAMVISPGRALSSFRFAVDGYATYGLVAIDERGTVYNPREFPHRIEEYDVGAAAPSRVAPLPGRAEGIAPLATAAGGG